VYDVQRDVAGDPLALIFAQEPFEGGEADSTGAPGVAELSGEPGLVFDSLTAAGLFFSSPLAAASALCRASSR
jgi:hypothetical protein